MKDLYIHLVSDATGATLQGLAQAALAQFSRINPEERLWPLIRSKRQLDRVLKDIEDHKGVVLFTLMNPELSTHLKEFCAELSLP